MGSALGKLILNFTCTNKVLILQLSPYVYLNQHHVSVIMCCTEAYDHQILSFITIKSLHIDLLIHDLGWHADVLWAQLVHSFDQVVDRVLLCGHLIIHTVSIHH